MFSSRLLAFLAAFFFCLSLHAQTPEYVPNVVLVQVDTASSHYLNWGGHDSDVEPSDYDMVRLFYNNGVLTSTVAFKTQHPILQNTYLLSLYEGWSEDSLIAKLERFDYIEYAERMPLYKPSLTPNDIQANQYNLTITQAEQAWDISTGNANIVVAIVDDAVLLTHEDLAPVIWTNPGEIPGNGIDDDGNGFIDDVNGWDAADNDNDPNPGPGVSNNVFSHGTHCAGIAGAATDNGIGIASIGHNLSIMPVKVAQDSDPWWYTHAMAGVDYAIASGAHVISMSYGGFAWSQTMQNLFDVAYANNIVCIASAGNNDWNTVQYPAGYNHVITIGATDSTDLKAGFSNYGTWVDLMAPGDNVYSCLAGTDSSYGYYSGTSMSCPLVAGLAGLMLSANPQLTVDQIEYCLEATCDNIDALNPTYVGELGGGRVNAAAAMACVASLTAAFTSELPTVCPGFDVQYNDISTNGPTSWQWTFPGGVPGVSTAQNPVVNYSLAGTYDVELIVSNATESDTLLLSNYMSVVGPSAVLSGTASMFEGYSVNLPVQLTGNPPWSVSYTDGTTTQTDNNITQSPHYINVSPTSNATYTLTGVNDAQCGGTFIGSATVTVLPGPQFGADPCSQNGFWTQSLDGPLADFMRDVEAVDDSTLFWTGATMSYGQGQRDLYAMRTDACGNVLWAKTYGDGDHQFALQSTAWSNGLTLLGSNSSGASTSRPTLNRMDTDGTLLWSRQYELSIGGSFGGGDVARTSDGGFWMLAQRAIGSSAGQLILIRTDAQGDVQFARDAGTANDDHISDLLLLGDTAVVTLGTRLAQSGPAHEALVIGWDTAGSAQWMRSYGIPETQVAPSRITKLDDGFLITGYVMDTLIDQPGMLVMRIDTAGAVIWANRYAGPLEDYAGEVAQLSSGNFLVVGHSDSYSGTEFDYQSLLLEIAPDGSFIRAATSPDDVGEAYAASALPDGSIYLGTESNSGSLNSYGAQMLKLSSTGFSCNDSLVSLAVTPLSITIDNPPLETNSIGATSTSTGYIESDFAAPTAIECTSAASADPCGLGDAYSLTFGGTADDETATMVATDDGGILLLGHTESFGEGQWDYLAIKLDACSQVEWAKTYGDAISQFGPVTINANGGYSWVGYHYSGSASNSNTILSHIDASGNLLLSHEYSNPSGFMYPRGLDSSYNNGYLIGAVSNAVTGAGSNDITLLRTDSQGSVLWGSTYGGTGNDFLVDLATLPDSGFIASGYRRDYAGLPHHGLLVRGDSLGNVIWSNNYLAGTDDLRIGAVLAVADGFIVTGILDYAAGTDIDLALFKVDLQGNLEWSITFGGAHEDRAPSLTLLPGNQFLLTAKTQTSANGTFDFLHARFDLNGNLVASRVIPTAGNEDLVTVGGNNVVTANGSVFASGHTDSFGAGGDDMVLMRLNENLEACGDTASTHTVTNLALTVAPPNLLVAGFTPNVATPSLVVTDQTPTETISCTSSSCNQLQFQLTYGTTADDEGHSLVQTADGGYAMAGWTEGAGAGDKDLLVIKVDSVGTQEWAQTIGGAGEESANSITLIQMSDGGYAVAAKTMLSGATEGNALLVRMDNSGAVLWSVELPGFGNDQFRSLHEYNGGFLLSGTTNTSTAGSSDGFLMRIAPAGNFLWSQQFGGPQADHFPACIPAADGGIVASGSALSFAPSRVMYVLKTDSVGTIEWQWTYDSGTDDGGVAVDRTNDGGYIITGTTQTGGSGGREIMLVRLDSLGMVQWSKIWGGPGEDRGTSVKSLADGGFIVEGHAADLGSGGSDLVLIRTDAQGNTLWQKLYGGAADDAVTNWNQGVTPTTDGGFAAIGHTASFGAGGTDFFFIKTNACGETGCNEQDAPLIEDTLVLTQSIPPTVQSAALAPAGIFLTVAPATIFTDTQCIQHPTQPIDTVACNLVADFSATVACVTDSTVFTDLSIDGNGANIVSWAWNFGDGTTASGLNPTHLYSSAGGYLVSLTVSTDAVPACTQSITDSVFVVDVPTIILPPDTLICLNDSVPLNAQAGCMTLPLAYQWSPAAGLSSATVASPNAAPTANTTYTVTVTDATAQVIVDSITVSVDPGCCVAQAVAETDQVQYCVGDTVLFTNNSVASPTATYSWDFGPDATPTSFTGQTPPAVTFGAAGNQDVTLTISDPICADDAVTITVSINALPAANAGNDIVSCGGDTVALGEPPIGNWLYNWSPATGLSDATVANPTLVFSGSGTWYVTVTDPLTGCSGTDSVQVSTATLVELNDTVACQGTSLVLAAGQAGDGITYSWSPATGLNTTTGDTVIARPADDITYTIIADNGAGCIDTVEIDVEIGLTPRVTFSTDIEATCDSVRIQFVNESLFGDSVLWRFGDGTQSNEMEPVRMFPFMADLSTELVAWSNDGCTDSTSLNQALLGFDDYFNFRPANVFTPNGDGINDYFEVGFDFRLADCTELTVFNRWGLQLFTSAGTYHSWDGRNFAGEEAEAGTYFYIITINDRDFPGTVTLLR